MIEGMLNKKLRDPEYRRKFDKKYKQFKDIHDSWGRLVEAGDDLVAAIKNYGGTWQGTSLHMRDAIDNWIAICGVEVTRIPPVDPKDLPSKRSK